MRVQSVLKKEKFCVGTGLVPVLTLKRTATRAVPTAVTPSVSIKVLKDKYVVKRIF